jgi:prevent-host-death family protein
MKKIVPKSEFKPKAFHFFRQVETTGQPLYVSDHGKPVIKISPVTDDEKDETALFRNSVLHYEAPLEPVGTADWEILK